ncbi:BQ2448_4381 [Microbotryum intermedium]|uniref:BQ2448_4381 protein n=1 Tax=Microbotryum intermedium TaxID=269621 RepID=A0A238FLV1_9BASI|nr:BQ2448_4381 [Microbotryum intermedium]
MVFSPPTPPAVPSSLSSLPSSGTAPASARPALGQLDVNRATSSSSSSSSQQPHRSLSKMTSKDKLKQWTFPRNGSPVLPSPPASFPPSAGTNSSQSTPLMGYSLSDEEANAQSSDPDLPVIIESRTNQYDRHVRRHSQDDERSSGSDRGIESPCGASSSIPFMQKRSQHCATNKASPGSNGTKQQQQHHKTSASTFRHRGNASVAVVPISTPDTSPVSPARPGLSRVVSSSPRLLTNSSANTPSTAPPEPMPILSSPSELVRMIYANLRRKPLQDLAWAVVFGVCLLLFASALTGHGYAPPELDEAANGVLWNQVRVEAPATFLPKGGQFRDLPVPADVHQPAGDDSHDVGNEWMKDSPDDRRLDDEHAHHHHDSPDALFEGDHSVSGDDHDHSHVDAVLDAQKPGRRELEELDFRTVELNAGVDAIELTQNDEVARDDGEVVGNGEEEQVQGEEEHEDGETAGEDGEEQGQDDSVQDEVEHDHDHGSGGLHLEHETDVEEAGASFGDDAKAAKAAAAVDIHDVGSDADAAHSIQYGEDVQALKVKRMLKQRRRR